MCVSRDLFITIILFVINYEFLDVAVMVGVAAMVVVEVALLPALAASVKLQLLVQVLLDDVQRDVWAPCACNIFFSFAPMPIKLCPALQGRINKKFLISSYIFFAVGKNWI